jgi:hypothetical protein
MVIFFKKTENTEKMTLKDLLAVFLRIILLFFLAVGTLFIASITGFAVGGIALLNTPTLLIDLLISLSEKQNKFVAVLIYLNVAVLLGIQMIMRILSAPLFLPAYGFSTTCPAFKHNIFTCEKIQHSYRKIHNGRSKADNHIVFFPQLYHTPDRNQKMEHEKPGKEVSPDFKRINSRYNIVTI